ncbi:MAG TPA: ESX secretion-associated protein EspG [Pseudonocardiaceae bacterium]|nr:ESX secretion-associated protein EspG [Pseudonocardiaceae bacterium]
MLYQQVTLSLDTLATVWQRENLGELHNVLVDVPVWRDEDENRVALQGATGELAQRGLLSGRDLHVDLRSTLEVLARPSMEYYGWIAYTEADREVNITVLVAAVGQDAVLVVRDGQQVHLSPTRADGMAETLLGHLPAVAAARGRSVNLPEAEVRQLVADRMHAAPGSTKPLPAEAFNIFPRASMAEDARDLLTAMDQPRIGGGELYVAARVRSGERRRCENPMVYVDTQHGRWMTQLSGGRAGERWIVSAPASRQLLLSKLNEMRNNLLG